VTVPDHGPPGGQDPSCGHDRVDLGAYAFGLLDAASARAVDVRLAACPPCRAEMEGLLRMTDLLGDQPPELFLDGPPDGDLVLRRAVRQVRAESGRRRLRRRIGATVAAAAVAAGVLGGGVAIGRAIGAPPAPVPVAGSVDLSGTGPGGVTMHVSVRPAHDWVRLTGTFTNIPAGQRCLLLVTDKAGHTEVAGSWVVPPTTDQGVTLDGSAAVALADIASVEVRNEQGKEFVRATA
jgi:hypothetical protein